MPRFTKSPQSDREAFGAELRRQRTGRNMSQAQLARELGLQSQGSVSGWEQGTIEPERSHVFQLEDLFGLDRGYLSSILGYGPPTHVDGRPARRTATPTLRRALAADERLTKSGRDALMGMYRALVSAETSQQGISPKGWIPIVPGLAA